MNWINLLNKIKGGMLRLLLHFKINLGTHEGLTTNKEKAAENYFGSLKKY